MGLYLGDSKVKISLNSNVCNINILSLNEIITDGVLLKTPDDYIIKDSNDLYLLARGNE